MAQVALAFNTELPSFGTTIASKYQREIFTGCPHPKDSPRWNGSDGKPRTDLPELAHPKGPSPMNWSVLQRYPELGAPLAVWLRELGPDFEPFKRLCLFTEGKPAQMYRCPLGPGRYHFIRSDGTGAIAYCGGQPPQCLDIPLSPATAILYIINLGTLGPAIARALGLALNLEQLAPPNTYLIGSWSANAVPVVLTLPSGRQELCHTLTELSVRLQRPFILLAPTSGLFTEHCRELLILAHAGGFSLESTVTLTSGGTLTPVQPPGVLLAAFTPQPTEGQDQL